jgi:2-dehydro-3-deoxyphosphogluconate aldolase/(4S)-4-hydroxy-2-oxoglutarate aldolase
MPLVTKTESYFAGDCIEVMKSPYFGRNGHIGIKCSSLKRTVFYLQNMGAEFNPEGFRRDAAGNMTVAYLKEEFGGFAVHFVEK